MDLAELDAGFNPNIKPNEGVNLTFFYRTVKDPIASAQEGRPIFKDREFVRITIAGDRDCITERVATERDRRTYPQNYARFKASTEQKSQGFPLEQWPGMTRAQVAELKFFNIHTVEELAAVSDANGQKFPMFQDLRKKAQLYLKSVEANIPFEKMTKELEQRDQKIALLEENLAALMEEAKARKAAEAEDDE